MAAGGQCQRWYLATMWRTWGRVDASGEGYVASVWDTTRDGLYRPVSTHTTLLEAQEAVERAHHLALEASV